MFVDTLDDSFKFLIRHFQNAIPVDVDSIVGALGIKLMPFCYEDGIPREIMKRIEKEKSRYARIDHWWRFENGVIIYNNKDRNFTICYNTDKPPTRQRFTIAHELAHYLLHKKEIMEYGLLARGDSLCYTNGKETQANFLAAEILMPLSRITEMIKKIKDSGIAAEMGMAQYGSFEMGGKVTLELLSENFNVSPQAMEISLNRRYALDF